MQLIYPIRDLPMCLLEPIVRGSDLGQPPRPGINGYDYSVIQHQIYISTCLYKKPKYVCNMNYIHCIIIKKKNTLFNVLYYMMLDLGYCPCVTVFHA